MIGQIQGVLIKKQPPFVLIDVRGVGYEIEVPMSTYNNLPEVGIQVNLTTHFLVREDAQQLFGFLSDHEKSTFKHLIKVSGIGPRVALAILSAMTVIELAQNIENNEIQNIVQIPGIGKKTADRMLLELKDRIGQFQETPSSQLGSTMKNDVLGALVSLGYGEKEILRVLARTNLEQPLSAAIKQALQFLSGVKKD